jgi:hypothetical protein
MLDRHQLTQMELSRKTRGEVDPGMINHCVNGHKGYQNPTLHLWETYARAFGMKGSQFMREFEEYREKFIQNQ